MAEPLFGVGAQLGEAAGQQATALAGQAQKNAQDNSANALDAVKQQTSFTGDLVKQQQEDLAKQKLAQMRYSAGYINIDAATALGASNLTGDPNWMKMVQPDGTGTPMHVALYTKAITEGIKAKNAKELDTQKSDEKDDKVVYGIDSDGKKKAGTMTKDDDGRPVWTPAKGDQGTDPNKSKTPSANSGLRSDEDAHKYADQWYDRADKAQKNLMSSFQKKLGLPEDSSFSDIAREWAGLPDKKKQANQAVFRQSITQYEHAISTYNKYAAAAGQDPFPEDKEGVQQLKALAGGASGGAPQKFSSASDVKAAYQSGKITRDQAKKELASFGLQ